METTKEKSLKKLQEAYALLRQRFTEGGRGVSLADAIDHTGVAIRSLGGEPIEKVTQVVADVKSRAVCPRCENDKWIIDRATLERGDKPTEACCSECGYCIYC